MNRLIGATLLCAGVVLAACEDDADQQAVPVEGAAPEVQPPLAGGVPPEGVAQPYGINVAQIIESPATWTGRTVFGEVRVTELASDRAFWIEDQGERLLVVLNEAPNEVPQIQAGQSYRISEAVVREPGWVGNIPGTITQETRNLLQQQRVFLTTDPVNVTRIAGTGGGAGEVVPVRKDF